MGSGRRHDTGTGTTLAKMVSCSICSKKTKILLMPLIVMTIGGLFYLWNIFQQHHVKVTKLSVTMVTKPHEAAAKEPSPPVTWQERSQFQQTQVEKFCRYHKMADIKHRLPTANEGSFVYFQHMLMDDKSKTIFCFAPKVGCTNLKVLFFVNQGLIPESELKQTRDKINQDRLGSMMGEHSFVRLSNAQREDALKNYFKFVMYRNPLERLVSGYRSKVERFPLIGRMSDTPHYNWLREEVYRFKHPVEYKMWYDNGSRAQVHISFSDFIDYWLSNPEQIQYDQHFRPISEICHPCRSRFDFYGNFRHFEEDAGVLRMRIHAKEEYVRSNYYNSTTETNYLLSKYYEQLNKEQKSSIFSRFLPELDLLYRIFPEERNSHKQILRIVDNISSPASESESSSVPPFTDVTASSAWQS